MPLGPAVLVGWKRASKGLTERQMMPRGIPKASGEGVETRAPDFRASVVGSQRRANRAIE
jgi:hypothetical protein